MLRSLCIHEMSRHHFKDHWHLLLICKLEESKSYGVICFFGYYASCRAIDVGYETFDNIGVFVDRIEGQVKAAVPVLLRFRTGIVVNQGRGCLEPALFDRKGYTVAGDDI